jgi:hypothetical protein
MGEAPAAACGPWPRASEVSVSVLAAASGIPIPGWLAAVFFSIWLVVPATMFGIEVRRSRVGAQVTWRRSFAEATRSFSRKNTMLVGRLVVVSAVGYLFLIALVARRWSAASIGLVVLPLVVTGIVGFRRLGRQISARNQDGSAQ